MRRLASALLVLTALTAGCGGGDGPTIPESRLPRLVLQPEDVPKGLTRFDEGPQAISEAPAGDRADPDRFGRRGGWKARYRRVGGGGRPGIVLVESRAELFGDADGAEQDLEVHQLDLEDAGGRVLEDLRLGDESVVTVVEQEVLGGTVRYYTVAWRRANVEASAVVVGRGISRGDAVALARKQDRRVRAAEGR